MADWSRAVLGAAHCALRGISRGLGGERWRRAVEARGARHVNSRGLVGGGARRGARRAARNQRGTGRGTGALCCGGTYKGGLCC